MMIPQRGVQRGEPQESRSVGAERDMMHLRQMVECEIARCEHTDAIAMRIDIPWWKPRRRGYVDGVIAAREVVARNLREALQATEGGKQHAG